MLRPRNGRESSVCLAHRGCWHSVQARRQRLTVSPSQNPSLKSDGSRQFQVNAEIKGDRFLLDRAIAALEELQQAYPGADIFLNGELTVDFPEDVRIPIEPNRMATAVLSGNRIKFEYCGLDRAIALLKEQYAIGNVEVRIVRPKLFS